MCYSLNLMFNKGLQSSLPLTFAYKKGIVQQQAQMVELVDTLVSGTSAFSGMEVRVFFWAVR